ncbi:MAG: SusC/RagA family TonB-linked outer membrane protein [Tannerellaceae bacterium]|nr:SusC/RagA family TonB-linked outer membrane protein [Tannerellaceae bacterium]
MRNILFMLMLCTTYFTAFAESSKTTGVDLNVGYSSGNEIAPITQQSKKISGVVSDEFGDPLIGVTVLEKGTQNGTVTDMDGNYTLEVQNNATLVFSFIGYNAQEIPVGSQSVINVLLKEDVQQLDDVVVVGYAIGNKRSISGAVERVRKEDMNQGVITEPLDALKGKVAGVVISGSDGDPAGDLNIRIRGTTSLSGGNDPLVIIDGVFGDLSMLNALSASDIESMTILKDASETAQYGSRGASGVIVVTTARGRAGFAQVEYNGTFGVNTIYKTIDMLSADQWRSAVNQLGINGNDMGGNTNWFDEITRNTFLQTHNFSISNGSEISNFRASLGVVDHLGLLINSGSRNYTAKIDGSQYMFDKKVKIDIGMFGARRENDMQYDIYRTFYSAASYNPTYPNVKNEDGVWDEDLTAIEVYNPLGMMETTNKMTASHANVHGSINWEIIKGLNLLGFGSYTYYNYNRKLYIPNDIQQGSNNGNGMARINNRDRTDLMGNLQLNFTRDFGKHSISALALLEAQKQTYFESESTSRGFETNYFTYNNLEAGANVKWGDVKSAAKDYNLLSYMVRANYMYDGKYVFTGNVRRDGSSKLGANNKWGFFPSASVAWIVTGEEFMQSLPSITNLKIRAGYGVTGNQDAIDPYNSLSLMEPNGTILMDGSATTTFAIASNANPDLRWEKKYTFDIGLDLSMFDSRLRFTADYYASRTKDMLYKYTVPVPPFVYTDMLANLGEMSNNGVELAVSGDIVKTKDFSFSMGVNLAFQRNRIESLSGTYMGEEFTTSQYIGVSRVNAQGLTSNADVVYLTEGQPVGVFHIPQFVGFIDSDGKKRMIWLI